MTFLSLGAQSATDSEPKPYDPNRPWPRLLTERDLVDRDFLLTQRLDSHLKESHTGVPHFDRTVDLVLTCPNLRTDRVMVHRSKPEMYFESCRRHLCIGCASWQAIQRGMAIRLAEPEWGIVITRVGNDFDSIRRAVADMLRQLRKMGCLIEMAWAAEANPKGDGVHVHGWARAADDPSEFVDRIAPNRHGVVLSQPIWQPEGPFTYPVKTVVQLNGTPLKTAQPIFDNFMALNGNRLTHHTRGFYRNEHGKRVGAKEATRAARRVRSQRRSTHGSDFDSVAVDRVREYTENAWA